RTRRTVSAETSATTGFSASSQAGRLVAAGQVVHLRRAVAEVVELARIHALDHPADDLRHAADVRVALAVAEDVAAGRAVVAVPACAMAATRAPRPRDPVAVDVVADVRVAAEASAAVARALPPAADIRVGRAGVEAVVDRAAEGRPAVAAPASRGAPAAGDDRPGRLRAEEVAERSDRERRPGQGQANEQAAPGGALLERLPGLANEEISH